MRKKWKKLFSYDKRKEQEENNWMSDGASDQKNLLYKLDRLMDYSGLRNVLPWACAEVYLMVAVLLAILGVVTGPMAGIGAMWGLVIGLVLGIAILVGIRMAADQKYNAIEEGLFSFVNAISSESRSSDNIIVILEASTKSICKPLAQVVLRCCEEARNTGKIPQALHRLELAVENEEFSKIIRNLSMCYRTDADYAKVIDQCRVGLKEHIAAREERKAIISTGKIEVIQLVGLGIITLVIIGNIIGEGNVFVYLSSFLLGRMVLIYLVAVMVWCIFDALLVNGRG